MEVRRPWAFKKAIWGSAITLVTLVISLLTLKTLYAVAFFSVITKNMQSSGWSGGDSNPAVQINETMMFEASYLFFKIGSVKFQALGKVEYNGIPSYHLRAHIDSYAGVPFVNFHSVYDTYADARTLFCLYNLRTQKDGNSLVYTATNFEFDQKRIECDQSQKGKLIKEVSLPLDSNYTNGVSFIYYLRKACQIAQGKSATLNIPIIDDTVRSTVTLTIDEKKEACDVNAFSFPLDSYRLSGHINFTGTFGITGDFVGWMAADSSAVPLKANMKVLLGSVVVQLKEIDRNNWIPPRPSKNE